MNKEYDECEDVRILYMNYMRREWVRECEKRERGGGDNKVGIDRERNSKCSNNVPVRNKYVNK